MSDEEHLNAAERELETALRALHPRPPAIDRDRMLFEAGQRSVRPQHRRPLAWPAVSGALAAALLVSVFLHRGPRYVERIVRVPAEPASHATTPERSDATLPAATWDPAVHSTLESAPPPTSYLILRKHALSNDESRTPTDPRHGVTRPPTRGEPLTDLPDAGFFGRASRTSRERL